MTTTTTHTTSRAGRAHRLRRRFDVLAALLGGRRGFTLVEVMVTLAVLAIGVGLVSVHTVANLPHKRLMGAARNVSMDMRQARAQAIREGRPYFVCFDVANSKYDLAWVSDPAAVDCSAALAVGAVVPANYVGVVKWRSQDLKADAPGVVFNTGLATVACPSGGGGTVVSFNNNTAVFNTRGSSVASAAAGALLYDPGAVYLTSMVKGVATETVCIRVLSVAGRSRVYRWNGAAWES